MVHQRHRQAYGRTTYHSINTLCYSPRGKNKMKLKNKIKLNRLIVGIRVTHLRLQIIFAACGLKCKRKCR